MPKLVGISTSPLAQGNSDGISSAGIEAIYGNGYNSAAASGTPSTATFIIDGQFNPNGAIFRVLLYENDGSRALVAYSDWIDDANIVIDAEETVPVTAVQDVIAGNAYFVSWERRADATGSPNIRQSSVTTTANKGTVDDGGATSGYTQDPQTVPDPLPAFDSGTGANQNGIILYFSSAPGPSITSVTDSVGSTADQITEGENADVVLDGDVGVQGTGGVELRNAAGTYVATLPVVTWNNGATTTITVTGARGQLRYGDTDNQVVVIQDDGTEIPYTGVTLAAPSGTFWVNGSSPDTTSDNSIFKNAVSAPTGDYQIIWSDPNNTGINASNPINSDGTVTDAAAEGDLPVKAWDATDGTTSAEATFTVTLQAPQGTVTITNVSVSGDQVTVTASYDDTDATGYQIRFDGGTPQSFTYPEDTFTLDGGTYSTEVRAVNDGGTSAWSSQDSFTIEQEAQTPKIDAEAELPVQGASTWVSPVLVGPPQEAFKLNPQGLPMLLQRIEINSDNFDGTETAVFRLPANARLLYAFAIVTQIFDDSGSNTLRIRTSTQTLATLALTSTGRLDPTDFDPPQPKENAINLRVDINGAAGDATTGQAQIFIQYTYEG